MFTFLFSVTLTCDLLTSQLLCQLLLKWVSSHPSLNVIHCSIFMLMVGAGQTDRHTTD